MGHDHPFLRDASRDLCQARRDILIRQAVKAVAADALGMEVLRNSVVIGDGRMLAMKCRVEARDLRQPGRLTMIDRMGSRLCG